jgi:hypothetical protein
LKRRVAQTSLVLCLSLAIASSADAQERHPRADATKKDPKSAEAARIKTAGDVLMDQERYADALGLYQKAYDLSGDPALLYNQGRALEAMGEYPEALDKLEQFDAEAPAALRARVPGLSDHIAELKTRIATIVVRSNAPGARLLLRQKAAGTIDRELTLRTRAGPATIEVTAEGYEPFRHDYDLSAGATLTVDAQLVPKKREALVVVRTRPAADITIDGRPIGRAPLETRLPPGPHELVAHAQGHQDERVAMTLALGDRRDLDLELKSNPPITAKWWFWTAIGVVVVGGAATAYALTTEKQPSSGSFTPGKVPAP